LDLCGGLEKLKTLLKAIFALAMGAVTVWSFMVPDAIGFQKPELARIFFWHFPCPILASILLWVGAWQSIRQFKRIGFKPFAVTPETDHRQKSIIDIKAEAAMELGYLFCLLTMATGIIFSEVQWGAWWQNDPRQTSFLMVLFIYAAYFGIRTAYSADDGKRATFSAAYALAAFIPSMFLIFVFPRLPQIASKSFHPTQSIMAGQIKGQYAMVVIAVMVLVSILSVWLYQMRVKAGAMELDLEEMNAGLEADSSNSTSTGVVRPVSLSN
jgi:heme exporter protein C